MNITELNRNQLEQLKQNYLVEEQESISWLELSLVDENISDEFIKDYYGDYSFSVDDFWQ